MSNANDIKNLFGRFGGNPKHYRELALENDAQVSAARWPLLAHIAQSTRTGRTGDAGSVFQSARPPAEEALGSQADLVEAAAVETVAPLVSRLSAAITAPSKAVASGAPSVAPSATDNKMASTPPLLTSLRRPAPQPEAEMSMPLASSAKPPSLTATTSGTNGPAGAGLVSPAAGARTPSALVSRQRQDAVPGSGPDSVQNVLRRLSQAATGTGEQARQSVSPVDLSQRKPSVSAVLSRLARR